MESRLRMIALSGMEQRPERAQEQDVGQEQDGEDEPGEGAVGEVEEVDPARRPAAGEDVDAVREAARRGRCRRAAGRRSRARPARRTRSGPSTSRWRYCARRVDALRAGRVERPRARPRDRPRAAPRAVERGLHVLVLEPAGAARVDHDRRRRERPAPSSSRDDVQPADALEVLRDALVRPRADLEREDRQRKERRGTPSSSPRRAPGAA